jgi:penicillin-binding protein 1C
MSDVVSQRAFAWTPVPSPRRGEGQGEGERDSRKRRSPSPGSPKLALAREGEPPSPRRGEGAIFLRRRDARRWLRLTAGAAAFVAAAIAALALAAYGAIGDIEARLPPLPAPSAIPTSTIVVDRNGKLLRPFTIADGRWRLPATKADVDPRFIEMLIGYEDRRFADHHGVDLAALIRAAGQFVLAGGHIVSGGSTLTMQVARLIDERGTRSFAGKLRQIAIARALEDRFTKDDILDLYLTLAPYGGNIEGVRAASLAYFGKEPGRLTIAEAATLVAIPQSPEARRPDRDPAAATAARDRVLDRLAQAGVIDEDTAAAATTERMPTARRPFPMLASHLADQAVAAHPDLVVQRLTIDAKLQASLEALARDRVATLGPKLSVAIVVADHLSGAVLASVGSAGLFEEGRGGYVDMTRAIRSPGSTLKPLIYGLAFEAGYAHPESLIEDRPTGFGGYVPQNFDGYNRGTVTVREALTQSLNVPAVVALNAVGPARLVARLKRAAVTAVIPDASAPGLAVGLGGLGVTLRDLVGLYAAIARGGTAVTLMDGIGEASVNAGTAPTALAGGPPSPPSQEGISGAPVLSPAAAWYVSDILSGVPPPINGSPGRIAYKTGTSYGYRDAWAIGFDGAYVVGVWIGRPDGTPVAGLSGIVSAAPILFEAFDRIGGKRAPLNGRPPGTIVASTTSALPAPLRRFRAPGQSTFVDRDQIEIAYPQDGVSVDLGIKAGDPAPLVIKVRNGAPPFTFFVNGAPIARLPFAREEAWQPEGSGFVTLSVVDKQGRSDRVTVFVE